MSESLKTHTRVAGWGLFALTLLVVGSTLTRPGIILLDWMNRDSPSGARAFVFGEPLPLELHPAEGRLRRESHLTDDSPADLMLVQMRQGIMDESMRRAIELVRPEYAFGLQGVPLFAVYQLD